MSLISKIKEDKAGTVLFLMSFSVILITLGIIQTLLFESLTLATFRKALFGFFGVLVKTLVITPFLKGLPSKAGTFPVRRLGFRGFLNN